MTEPARCRVETAKNVHERRFATARRSEQDEELAGIIAIDVAQRPDGGITCAVDLGQPRARNTGVALPAS